MKKTALVTRGGPTGEKPPQGLDLQRKRRGKKNFSGPGKRFLSQSAGKALRQSLPGLPAGAVLLPVAGSGAGQNEGEGAGTPSPYLLFHGHPPDHRQQRRGRCRSDGTPVRQACGHVYENTFARCGPFAGRVASPPRGHGLAWGHRRDACRRSAGQSADQGGGHRACGRSGGRHGDRRSGQDGGRLHTVRDAGPEDGPVVPGPRAGRHGGAGGRCRCGGRGRRRRQCRVRRSACRSACPRICPPAGHGSSGAVLRSPRNVPGGCRRGRRAGPTARLRSCGHGGACRAVRPPGPGP